MKMTYRQWLRLLFAKGYKLEAVEEEVQGLGFKRGFSKTSLSGKGKSDEPAPPKLVEFAWKAKLEGSQEEFELYARHLASMGVDVPPELADKFALPPQPKVDPQEIAEGLTPKLDALLSPVGERLDSALSALAAKLDAMAASLRGKLDAFTSATERKLDSVDATLGRLHATADENRREMNNAHLKLAVADGSLASARRTLDGVKTTVNNTQAQVDVMAAEIKRSGSKAVRSIWAASGCVILVVSTITLLPSRSRAASSAPCVNAVVVTSIGADGTLRTSDPQSWLAAPPLPMGEKPLDQDVPIKPFPGQKVPPCDDGLREQSLNGGCWQKVEGPPPCGGKLYRYGDACYRPIGPVPKPPIGQFPEMPQHE